ncbi:MAG: hypothetical protein JSS43_22685 [Proteobacteria bacterium]|nr:hypothetical protein [Pseudomonadota bacterium]
MSEAILDNRRRALENAFFVEHDRRLINRLAHDDAHRAEREAITAATGITDPVVIDQFVALDLRGSTLAALAVVPLVAVAWADGSVGERERAAVLAVAVELGFDTDSESFNLLEDWLMHEPPVELLSAWEAYTAAFISQLDEAGRTALHDEVVTRARAVAEAQGGFLSFGRVSQSEEAVLRRLEAALTG